MPNLPLRNPLATRPLPDWLVATLCALFLLTLDNQRFWQETWSVLGQHDGSTLTFLAAFFTALLLLFTAVLNLLALPGLFKPVAAALLLVAAVVAHFMDAYGVHINREMIRNVHQTDVREAWDLLNSSLLGYFLALGVAPAWVMLRLPIRHDPGLRGLGKKLLISLGCVVVAGVLVLSLYNHFASFFRNNHAIRQLINPSSVIYASVSYVKRLNAAPRQPPTPLTTNVHPRSPAGKDLLVVLVVGETARAANFQLDGYSRETNPELAALDVQYFNNTFSCGTDTAVSVPCMFTNLSRESYDADAASRQENLLDVARRGGARVVWLDNNSGCKGVCERVDFEDVKRAPMPDICNDGVCYDDVLLRTLTQRLDQQSAPLTLVVLHQHGSHGPAYFRGYPESAEFFKPACRTPELSRCSREEIVASYDNTIRYTDHTLAGVIRILQERRERYDSALYYVSDHGESLGEANLFLHGMPYAIAPEEQKRVPMVMWLAPEFQSRFAIDGACLARKRGELFSHHNLFFTVLGMLDLETDVYRAGLDILADCRQPSTPATP